MSINMAAMSPTYTYIYIYIYIYICIYFRSILGHKNNEHGSHVTYKLVGSRSVGSSYVRVCAHPAPKNLPDSQLLLSGFTVCVGFLQGLLELLFHTIYKRAFQMKKKTCNIFLRNNKNTGLLSPYTSCSLFHTMSENTAKTTNIKSKEYEK